MLAIKLKNNRNFAVVLIIVVLLLCSLGMVAAYPVFAEVMEPELKGQVSTEHMENFMDEMIRGGYYLYNEVNKYMDQNRMMQLYGSDGFFLMRKYMDCEVFSPDGEGLLSGSSSETDKRLLQENTDYGLRAAFEYDSRGQISVEVDGASLDENECYRLEQAVYRDAYDLDDEVAYILDSPGSVTIVYAFTEQNLQKYIQNQNGVEHGYSLILSNNERYLYFEWIFIFVAAAAALIIPCNKSWKIEEALIFKVPLEAVLFVWGIAASMEQLYASVVWNTMNHTLADILAEMGLPGRIDNDAERLLNVMMWFCVFAVVYWGTTCLRAVFTMKKRYWKERTLCAHVLFWVRGRKEELGEQVKQGADGATGLFRKLWRWFGSIFKRAYNGLINLDILAEANQAIFKIVLVNFILLTVICCFWFYGIVALLIYSGVVFILLRRSFYDIQKKYQLLLESMNLLAEGILDAPISGDLGIFNPMKTEILRIQKGFKKAVEEEVKSERMKTELITNVSHDLKTPLTAIITYVDLLKSEEDPQKRKEYLAVLERKSQRLKVLIEDLFEISKAASRNVTMNFMRADIVELLKQVELENSSRIREAGLDFRWSLPKEKVILLLDSQKTYRIFENLIVNITKYAMPHTRVYIELKDEGNEVWISMKNVSAAELNFNADEITDRFVRGDASRNTEGSGLGLAIAKSFTELQYGTLKVTTEADLFKVNIWIPKRMEEAAVLTPSQLR